ncbi:MAG: glycosyltransferase family 39 protein [Planctomycetes bacterium]|nr:glycosyltransferase family 39 protein [Planctomycetota bacterium]
MRGRLAHRQGHACARREARTFPGETDRDVNAPPTATDRPRLPLAGLFVIALLAFALRVAVAAKFQGLAAPPDAASTPDQLDYEAFAWSLADGHGYALPDGTRTARRPPGTSVALLPVYWLRGRDFAAARIWFAALSAVACLGAGLLAGELFGRRAALLAALALALLPNHFYYAQHFLSEVPYGAVIALCCWFGVRTLKRLEAGSAWLLPALLTGLAFGAALLTRPQVAFAGPVVLLGALLSPPAQRGVRVRAVVVVGIASALLLLPWMARNQLLLGRPTLTTIGGFTFWGANNGVIAADPERVGSWMPVDTLVDAAHPLGDDEIANDAATWRYGREWLAANPGEIPRLLVMKLGRHFSAFRPTPNRAVYWSFAAGWLLVAPLVLLGLRRTWREARAGTLILLAPVASTLVTALVFYGSIRFRDADAALYVVPAAAAVAALLDRRRTRPA